MPSDDRHKKSHKMSGVVGFMSANAVEGLARMVTVLEQCLSTCSDAHFYITVCREH